MCHLHFHYLLVLLQQKHSYHLIQEANANLNAYTFSLICSGATFSNRNQHIDVIVSKTAAIGPILQFHSTSVMNFKCLRGSIPVNFTLIVSIGTPYLCYGNMQSADFDSSTAKLYLYLNILARVWEGVSLMLGVTTA